MEITVTAERATWDFAHPLRLSPIFPMLFKATRKDATPQMKAIIAPAFQAWHSVTSPQLSEVKNPSVAYYVYIYIYIWWE
jgi:hypothetical protein